MSELQNVSCLGGGVQFWKDFIKIYEESPALWDPRSMAYKKPYLKREAYTKLRDKLREIDANVQIDYVKRRINGLRSCYRRELRRIQDSKRKGDNLYRPTLFYFKEMNFLDDVLDIDIERDEREGKIERRGRKPNSSNKLTKKRAPPDSTQSSSTDEDSEKSLAATTSKSPTATQTQQQQQTVATASTQQLNVLPLQSTSTAAGVSNTPALTAGLSIEAQTLGASWVALYHRLERDQQLYANKAIMEVLYQGALGRLHADSYKSLESDMSHNFLDDHRIMDAINEELAADFITKADVEGFY
ncbi:PREDICTED: uncharacterized protein LOC108968273 [Bactrocera latifrons]|uniref:uncharacterized protein LOC108968273 n=1 Tax=Bactrocera latifrons TaxID=174628 RepID=UPI0008DE997C|nr:PREDICTED: uncharacterized protein LOC108968273 [Bactrocera latifrons]